MKKLDNRGSVAIILCLGITFLLGIAAYVIDIGLVYAEKTKLSNAIDSAALAAALELPDNDMKARTAATDYLEKNGVSSSEATVNIGNNNKSVEIQGTKKVIHLFAPIIGINNSTVKAFTKAAIGPIKSTTGGIRPFAVQKYDFSYGSVVILKQHGGDGYHGNYGAVALGGTGAEVFKENALYGYNGTISVGDYIDTETGNMAGATNIIKNYIDSENSTFNNFPRNSIRLWKIPLVDTLQVNGRNQILVTGFGEFYVEDVGQKSGEMEITGRFIRYVTNAEIDTTLNDTGAYGEKLVK